MGSAWRAKLLVRLEVGTRVMIVLFSLLVLLSSCVGPHSPDDLGLAIRIALTVLGLALYGVVLVPLLLLAEIILAFLLRVRHFIAPISGTICSYLLLLYLMASWIDSGPHRPGMYETSAILLAICVGVEIPFLLVIGKGRAVLFVFLGFVVLALLAMTPLVTLESAAAREVRAATVILMLTTGRLILSRNLSQIVEQTTVQSVGRWRADLTGSSPNMQEKS